MSGSKNVCAAAALCLISLGACASAADPPAPTDRKAEQPCGRREAVERLTGKWMREGAFRLSRPAADACGRGDLIGCAAVPVAAATAILFTPFVPLVGAMASEADAKHYCNY